MKRIITLLIIVFFWARVDAQDVGSYQVEVSVSIYDGVDNHSGSCDNRFELWASVSGGSNQLWWSENVGGVNTTPTTFTRVFWLSAGQSLSNFYFWGTRHWKNAFDCNGYSGTGDTQTTSYFGCLPTQTYTDIIPYWGSTVTVRVIPNLYNLFYFGTGGSSQSNPSTWYLPQSNRVTIKATQGYASNIYGWQYQIGNGAWVAFSSSLYSDNTLSFSGNDISSDYFNTVLASNQTVRVRSVGACGSISNVMQLVPVLTAPGILGQPVVTAPSCSGVSDGKIKITLNRALYTGETLSIVLNGVVYASNLTRAQFAADNSYTLTGLPSGTRIISFLGAYNGRPSFTNGQTWTVTIPVTSFSFTITSSNIHCPGGLDGKINITTQGGRQPYIALLEQPDGETQQTLFSGTTGSFPDLAAGTYVVRLVDSRACTPRDANGNIVERTATITQPTSPPVSVTVVSVTPSQPGQSTGAITVRATGGSGIYSFVWIEINTGAIFTAEPPVADGNGVRNRLSGIPAGEYQVVVRDSEYPFVDPQNEQNTAGCQAVAVQVVPAMGGRVASVNDLADEQVAGNVDYFYVTPNPASGRFAARVSLRDAGDFTLTLLNSQGTVVSQRKYTAESNVTADFEMSTANKRGIYLLRLTTAQKSSAVRVVIE
ncbi:T9SS type A sorting domain-containing protein [Parachryseolinea silvisoli]|uniref:T9SS type A sorting domain-containing protein n=1 Tax=Parachryseolinea silvisoli TaxID=2873601 RepID=UPI002265AB93|nr:T9SS type A sorting domain-containing protein [Parachryseolinea silvisoli]MCD9019943.1 T9SS type A sorting domain-containing protein [Parachryseolinea silvisoli]